MSVKNDVLYFLEMKRGESVSGETIASSLSVSRNAVFKAVNQLKTEGYDIISSRAGYSLSVNGNSLSVPGIEKYLGDKRYDIKLYSEVSSTNTVVKAIGEEGGSEWTVVIAEKQTAGRGRLGRSFASPERTGIYVSILLRPYLPAEKTLFITVAAAVAVARAIELNSQKKAEIKWVNDVYVDGKKVCGILTEASFDTISERVAYAVLGVGINVSLPAGGFGEGLDNIAGAVFEKSTAELRSKLVSDFINIFSEYYDRGLELSFDEYRKRQFLLGKAIEVIRGNTRRPATAVSVDDNCRLCVKYDDGTEEALSSGEVSTRKL